MTDLDRIHEIEEILGVKLKQVNPEEISTKDFYTNNPFWYSLTQLSRPSFPYKGARSFCINEDGTLTGLSLDFLPVWMLRPDTLSKFSNLKYLSLRSAEPFDFRVAEKFAQLEYLDLGSNAIGDISFLLSLPKLKSLNLGNSNIKNLSILKEIKGITSLDLSFNQLTDVSFLKELKGITSLYLSSNQLTDFSFLKEFKGITSLFLSSNKLTDVSFLKELKGITSLDLSSNKLTDVSFLKELKGITSLFLSSNKLTDFSFLKELKGITSLDLSSNKLTDVSFLKELKGITSLDLSDNQLTDVSFLKELKGITSLFLSSNQLTDYSFLKELKGITSLDLSSNKLTDFSFLKELKGITSLDLRNNQLTDFPFLKELKGITSLYLSSNKLTDISFLKELKGITSLDLRNNKLTDVSFLKELKGITSLDLSYNPIKTPPPEVVNDGLQAIRNYFKQMDDQGKDVIYEAKMLVIGDGGSGKTSLVRKLTDETLPMPEEEDSTRGIDILGLTFDVPDKEDSLISRNLKLNVWDFGGQHIYHSTHRFFLSDRALYTLVADTREGGTDFNYWFQIMEKFGGESPVLPVINEKLDRTQPLENFYHLRSRYPAVRDKVHANISTLRGMDTIKSRIKELALTLPDIGIRVPAKWKVIREQLDSEKRNCIEYSEFISICGGQGLSEEDVGFLAGFLHNLGAVLYFGKNDLLRNKVFLKPKWVTDAVFLVIDSAIISKQQGEFTRGDAALIWHKDEYKNLLPELLELMKSFTLIYQVNGTDRYIMPQFLPQNQPKYETFIQSECKTLRYRFDEFMPRGILHQLITSLHNYIKDKESKENHKVWFSGVILQHRDTEAEILESYSEKMITIRVKGAFPRDLILLIVEQLDKICSSYHRLIFDKFLHCLCSACKSSAQPHEYSFNDLLRFQKDRQPIQCSKSYKMIEPSFMLDELFYRNEGETERMPRQFNLPRTPPPSGNEVYFSYAWDDEDSAASGQNREQLVYDLYEALKKDGINVKRDKNDLNYRGLISDFMKEIGRGNIIVTAITDKYLRSQYCMGELLEIHRMSQNDIHLVSERIIPIRIEKLKLDDIDYQDELFVYWEDQGKKYREHFDKHGAKMGPAGLAAFKRVQDISQNIGALVETLIDINSLTKERLTENNFEIIKNTIRQTLGKA